MEYVIHENATGLIAGSQAREDFANILKVAGWNLVDVEVPHGSGVSMLLSSLFTNLKNWRNVLRVCESTDILVIQYPLVMGKKISTTAIPYIKRIKSNGTKVVFLVHDLDSLRGGNELIEKAFLSQADGIIAHNAKMRQVLLSRGVSAVVSSLEIFDYPMPQDAQFSQCEDGIDIAGNLDPRKAGYAYKLAENFPDGRFNLFGPNFDEGVSESKWYKGAYNPLDLIRVLRGRFGLVWDGDSVDTCSGYYGQYLKVNNPHKLSMYLAFGKPVLIWNQAAEAEFVVRNGAGLAVSSIAEAVEIERCMTSGEHQRYVDGARAVGSRLRKGDFSLAAVNALEKDLAL